MLPWQWYEVYEAKTTSRVVDFNPENPNKLKSLRSSDSMFSPNILGVVGDACTVRAPTQRCFNGRPRRTVPEQYAKKVKGGWHPSDKREHLSALRFQAHQAWWHIQPCRLRPCPVGTNARRATPTGTGAEVKAKLRQLNKLNKTRGVIQLK